MTSHSLPVFLGVLFTHVRFLSGVFSDEGRGEQGGGRETGRQAGTREGG